jgi:hypothetical protein
MTDFEAVVQLLTRPRVWYESDSHDYNKVRLSISNLQQS